MQDIQADIAGMKQDPKLLHEPLKRLALHLAEQLTLTELSLSSNSIEALVLRCIETLDIPKSSPIAVELNPSDMAILQARTTRPRRSLKTLTMMEYKLSTVGDLVGSTASTDVHQTLDVGNGQGVKSLAKIIEGNGFYNRFSQCSIRDFLNER